MDNNSYFRKQHPDIVTLPQYFKNQGYDSLRTGKIFHGGIDDMVSWTEGGEPVDQNILNRPPSPVATGRGARETNDPRRCAAGQSTRAHFGLRSNRGA